jgi:hypothetical protein
LVTFTQNLQSPVAPALSGAQVFASEEHHKMFSIGPYQGMKTTNIMVWISCSQETVAKQVVSGCLWDTGRWPKCGFKKRHPTTTAKGLHIVICLLKFRQIW